MIQFSQARTPSRRNPLAAVTVCLTPLLMLGGCAAFPTFSTTADRPATAVIGDTAQPVGLDPSSSEVRQPQSLQIPQDGARAAPPQVAATEAQIAALVPDEMVDATLVPQPIPQFIASVFGNLIGVPYSLSAEAAGRSEVMAGGTGGTISKRELFRLTQRALQEYGLEVQIDGQFVRIGGAQAGAAGSEIVRGRIAPTGGGRVVQFFPVQTIEVSALEGLIRDLFPTDSRARVTLDQLSNSLIISGSSRDVAEVVRLVREIDKPRFAGAEVLRIEPAFLSADNLTTALEQALNAEGYVVSRQAVARRSITMLTFATANQILVFAENEELLDRVRFWVAALDQPTTLGERASTFVYQVRNTDAGSLGQLASGQAPSVTVAQAPVGVPGTAPLNDNAVTRQGTPGQSGQFLGGRLLTDPIGNRILFTGTASDYAQLRNLLQTLDQPAPQVVIEVIIAEVTLTDKSALGVNMFGTETRGDGLLSGGTEGVEIGAGGLLVTFSGPEFRARLNAEASNNRINILQRPQIVARSGGTARFQVGTDVPIITSQRATDTQSGNGGTDILQSVQYRQTGVILEIQPVIFGDRVDLTISQEISSAGEPPNAAIASPTILNRSITTQIALTDGWTGVLGGLISNNYSTNNTGVPYLKDLPIVGQAFQSNSLTGDRTELLVMITPHIIRNDEDMADLADQYSSDMNAAFRTGRGWSYTLTPFSAGSRIRGIGFDLPTPGRASEAPPLFGTRPARGAAQTADEPASDDETPPEER
ncbi:secretin N-terminal domain-containing protein [Brevundimonas sp.]|uniref:secretin N-terminal domain-containing protein n=1 Tax=Brevundimonas sp. TaxID=1871086 RepID=UPI00262A3AFC|nr:secretin N-terminal domain-containing protein [Brevundimonas sp.]